MQQNTARGGTTGSQSSAAAGCTAGPVEDKELGYAALTEMLGMELRPPEGLHPDVEAMWLLLELTRELHKRFYDRAMFITEKAKKQKDYSKEVLVDLGFLQREAKDLLDDWRKDCQAREELYGKLIALLVIQSADSVNTAGASDTVQGKLARGVPDLKMIAELPKPGTHEFASFCKHFNIDEATVSTGLIKLDWKKAQDEMTRRAQVGEKLPPGIGKTYPSYVTVFTRKK